MLDHRRRGILFLVLGAIFPLVLLVGGGVISSTHGDYWTRVFLRAYVIGLAFPGVFVYRSAKRQAPCTAPQIKPTPLQKAMFGTVAGSTLFLWLLFFKSEFFSSSAGMHGFLILVGVALSQLIPLGLGLIFSDSGEEGAAHG